MRKDKAATKEYDRERYQWRKSHGMCVKCGIKGTPPGRTQCPECAEFMRMYMREYLNDGRKRALRERYAQRRAAGVCVYCETPTNGGVYCDYHREKRRYYRTGKEAEE